MFHFTDFFKKTHLKVATNMIFIKLSIDFKIALGKKTYQKIK